MVNYWSNVIQLVLPEKCFLCHRNYGVSSQTGLCLDCQNDLPWLRRACYRCALPLPTAVSEASLDMQSCGQCQTQPPAFDVCHSLFHYQSPIDRLISRFKFNQQLGYGRLFGQLMAEHIKHQYRGEQLPDMVIPVPLHKRRLRERGFNQAQELARVCAKTLAIPLNTQHCRRNKHTEHQLGLSAMERHRNLKRAFSSQEFEPSTSVALVDDVMTTGTTLHELSACLKKAGCEQIHLWCIARAHHL